MITADDIKLFIASGEGYNTEFKLSVPSKVKELSEEICAFANAAGGVLLIGVNDKNQIIGLTIDNAKRSAIQNSMGEISPHLSCSLQIVKVDGKDIGVIEVPSGPNKPYVLSGAIYVRIGPNTQKLTTAEQMRDFFQTSGKMYFEEMPCTGFEPDTMVDTNLLALFKTEARMGANVPDSQLFNNLKLYTNGQTFKNGAALFFGKEPEAFMEKAVLRCVAFDGKDKRYIADDKLYGGNLYE
jgi:ATP-dependent DNA helicase RecG